MTTAHSSRDLTESTAVSKACFQMPAPKAHGSAQQGEGRCGTLQEGDQKSKNPGCLRT